MFEPCYFRKYWLLWELKDFSEKNKMDYAYSQLEMLKKIIGLNNG